jgi:hypothetical protein
MKARKILRQVTPSGRALGIVFLLVGAAMLLAAIAANNDASAIGVSTDPVLTRKYNDLTHLRDLYGIIGVSAFFLGAFSLIIMTEKSINPMPAEAEMISQARIASQMMTGLNLYGNAVYLSRRGALTSERIFIPATRSRVHLPTALADDLALSPGNDGSTPGAVLIPLGIDLLAVCEKEAKRGFAGIGLVALENDMQALRFGFGLLKDFHIKESDGQIILRVEYSGLKEACKTVRTEMPDTCRQLSCFGCSCILTGIAKAIDQAVRVDSVDNDQDVVLFRLGRV